MQRSSGVLLNISSLPGEFGIGGFSIDAKNFIEYITTMGMHWWQILPLTTIGDGNSPYSGLSAFAGNFLYIDPYSFEEGLLTHDEIVESKYTGSHFLTDYDYAYKTKKALLRKAFSRITPEIKHKISNFRKKHSFWLEDYSVFMALSEYFDNKPWYEWPNEFKFREEKSIEWAQENLSDSIEFYLFEQYEFFTQWHDIKDYAKSCGVGIFGDMPIYVCLESVDVWANPDNFQLDKDMKPKVVAGVPPDYFAEEGQLWGNPIYDYKKMKKDKYKWLIKRIIHNFELYDMLRVDHFRGLHQYWAVPVDSKTAKVGEWVNGPGMAIWKELEKHLPDANIIAEDLGLIDEGVRAYLKKTGFYGMRVMQFGFDGDTKNTHLPHNYSQECIGYTGTHDNDTTLGWLMSLSNESREYILRYVNCNEKGWLGEHGVSPVIKAFIHSLIASSCNTVIFPMQDLCGYGSDTRMNVPGKAKGNWRYRTNYTAMDSVDRSFILEKNNIYGRNSLDVSKC